MRSRTDSLCNITQQHLGRKRAMTIDSSINDKYVPIHHSKKSAFSSFRNAVRQQEAVQETKEEDDDEVKEEVNNTEVKLSRKRTALQMKKDFPSTHPQPLLEVSEGVSQRKRAKSF